jgi:hypothetical protein
MPILVLIQADPENDHDEDRNKKTKPAKRATYPASFTNIKNRNRE